MEPASMTRPAVFALAAIFTASLSLAQDVAGNWVAIPSDSGALRHAERIVLKLTRDRQGALAGTAFAGHLGEQFFRITSISLNDSKVTFVLGSAGSSGTRDQASTGAIMSFTGTVSGDGKSTVGWMQGRGFNERLSFERTGKAPAAKASPEKPGAPAVAVAAAAPPAVAPAAAADSSALLSRALEKLAGTRQQLLKYTCLETIERSYFSGPAGKAGTDVMNEAPRQSCSGLEFGNNGHLDLSAEDRLRLEVAVADGKEIDSWASANSFDSRSIHDVVSTGPTSTGAFGTALVDIFENPGAHYTFLGQANRDSRVVFLYAFEVPLDASHSSVKLASGWRQTAYRGSFEIDAATAFLREDRRRPRSSRDHVPGTESDRPRDGRLAARHARFPRLQTAATLRRPGGIQIDMGHRRTGGPAVSGAGWHPDGILRPSGTRPPPQVDNC